MRKKEEPRQKSAGEKPIPAFLRPDYPYQASGEEIKKPDRLEPNAVYEIKCPQCEMSVRSQGGNICSIYEKLCSTGCIGCGNKALVIREVDLSIAAAIPSDENG